MEDPLIGKVLLGRYLVARVLGRGGMSTVYRGEQQIGGITRPVAIKVLDRRSTADPKIVERFRREAETIVRLRHPNTVEIYDVGEIGDGTTFFVMEFVEGEPLSTVIRRAPLSSDRVDKILLQVCGSLHDAHTLGVVHRDLKPANVVLTNRGIQTDFVKVLDFGLAKTDWDGEKLTADDRLLGTPAYMSPEQFMNTEVDMRSDIYALGVMTYQMVAGKLPFQAKSPWDWASKHTNDIPPPIGKFADGTPLHPRKEKAIMRALSKKPEQRHANVLEFLRDFTGFKNPSDALAQATSGTGGAPGASSFHPPPMEPGSSSGGKPKSSSQDKSFVMGTLDLPAEQKRKLAPQGLLGNRAAEAVAAKAEETQVMSSDLISEVSVAAKNSLFPTAPPPPTRSKPPPTPVAALSIPTAPPAPKPKVHSPFDFSDPPAASGSLKVDRSLAEGSEESVLATKNFVPGRGGGAFQELLLDDAAPRAGRRGGAQDLELDDVSNLASIPLATDAYAPAGQQRSLRPAAQPAVQQHAEPEGPSVAVRAVKVLAGLLVLCVVAIAVYMAVGAGSAGTEEAAGAEDAEQAETPEEKIDDAQRQKLTEMREKMRGGDLFATLDFLEAASQDPTYPEVRLASLRVELSPKGGDEVERLIRQGKCRDAQRLYVRLMNVDAGMGSRDKFGPRCARP